MHGALGYLFLFFNKLYVLMLVVNGCSFVAGRLSLLQQHADPLFFSGQPLQANRPHAVIQGLGRVARRVFKKCRLRKEPLHRLALDAFDKLRNVKRACLPE